MLVRHWSHLLTPSCDGHCARVGNSVPRRKAFAVFVSISPENRNLRLREAKMPPIPSEMSHQPDVVGGDGPHTKEKSQEKSQLSSAVVADGAQTKAEGQNRNWGNNFSYGAVRYHFPESVEQIQEIVSRCRTVKALGSRHSFSTIADTTADMISMKRFPRVVDIDCERHTVTVSAGVRYGDLCCELDQKGFAFRNMASLPHISVVGACSTATHGSGQYANLATFVVAVEIVIASGAIVKLSRDQNSDQFFGAVVSLGAMGVITKLTLDIVPAFTMRQYVYLNMPWSEAEAHFDEIHARAYSVSFLLDWNPDSVNQVWFKFVDDEKTPFPPPEKEFFGAKLAEEHVSTFLDNGEDNFTDQEGIPGRWYERLPHFRFNFIPGKGEELQSEFFVSREHAVAALRAVRSLREQIQPILFCTEIRTIEPDNLWMSPSYQRDSISIGFTWKPDVVGVSKVLPRIEEKLAPFAARPHWAKVFSIDRSQLQEQYPRLQDFQSLLCSFDPDRKFRNAFLDKYIYPD